MHGFFLRPTYWHRASVRSVTHHIGETKYSFYTSVISYSRPTHGVRVCHHIFSITSSSLRNNAYMWFLSTPRNFQPLFLSNLPFFSSPGRCMTNKSYWTLTKELLPMMCGRELNIGHSEHVTDNLCSYWAICSRNGRTIINRWIRFGSRQCFILCA